MPISGITAAVQEDELEFVKREIVSALGGEIADAVDNHLAVVLEAETDQEMKNKFEELSKLVGVISTNLVYYNREECLDEV